MKVFTKSTAKATIRLVDKCSCFAVVKVRNQEAIVVYYRTTDTVLPIERLLRKRVLPVILRTHKGKSGYENFPNLEKSSDCTSFYEL